MKAGAIQIRKEDVTQDIRMLAELMNLSITDAVAVAVKKQLAEEQAKKADRIEEKRRKSREIMERLWALPVVGPKLSDADLYDEDGLPKSICD
ncbi:MAG: type II toxin-antitoxin system VapB family antitoxin [Bryobacter sp.]|nr:type II toxin-antitoxin system VapB family antitoxin [Bryobacter sp.]